MSSEVKTSMKTSGFVLLAIGVISLIIQNTFYGYMDAEGIIHDSLFLPVGVLSLLLSLSLFIILGFKLVISRFIK